MWSAGAGGTQIGIVVNNNVDQTVTVWCQKEQIKIQFVKIHASPSNNNVPNKVKHTPGSPCLFAAGHRTIRFLLNEHN
jgi:hypothetical protein